jgi:hypothetical protein
MRQQYEEKKSNTYLAGIFKIGDISVKDRLADAREGPMPRRISRTGDGGREEEQEGSG